MEQCWGKLRHSPPATRSIVSSWLKCSTEVTLPKVIPREGEEGAE